MLVRGAGTWKNGGETVWRECMFACLRIKMLREGGEAGGIEEKIEGRELPQTL